MIEDNFFGQIDLTRFGEKERKYLASSALHEKLNEAINFLRGLSRISSIYFHVDEYSFTRTNRSHEI